MKNHFSLLLLLGLLGGSVACRNAPGPAGSATTGAPVSPVDTSSRFRNPLLAVGPDPWVTYHDGFYYVMHTTGHNLQLYKTRSMSRLGTSLTSGVWTPPGTGPATRDIWAPEIHRVNGRWYIYYAAVVSPNTQHRMYVVENEAADPMTGTWTLKGQVQLPDDRWAIDGTLLQLNGQLYYAWSGWKGGAEDRNQHIYLCRMRNPWTAEGPRVRLSSPDLDWEQIGELRVNEGPQFLVNGNRVFIVYSASHCSTDAYTLGMLSAPAGADLTNPASWTKSPRPVFGPSAADGTFGVGHNSFFTTPDGKEHWILYHANPEANLGCSDRRSVRMQPFTYTTDGTPNFGRPLPLNALQKRPSGE